jgi:hypothetical protein
MINYLEFHSIMAIDQGKKTLARAELYFFQAHGLSFISIPMSFVGLLFNIGEIAPSFKHYIYFATAVAKVELMPKDYKVYTYLKRKQALPSRFR